MDSIAQIKNYIDSAKNICILPASSKEENIAYSLALFYTLKELNKNVNLAISPPSAGWRSGLPEKIKFLVPSLDYISSPKDLIISIPGNQTEISQVKYEKEENALKIRLTSDKGNIKKNDIVFSFAEPQADLLINIGANNVESQTNGAPIINIIGNAKSLPETILELINAISDKKIKNETATALLAGLTLYSDNFKDPDKTTPPILQAAALLIEKNADRKIILNNLYKNP